MFNKNDPTYGPPEAKSTPARRDGADGLFAFLVAVEVVLVIILVPSFNAPFRNLFSQPPHAALDPGALVWANKDAGVYYCPSSTLYGSGAGAYMKQGDALTAGYQPDLGNYCSMKGQTRDSKPITAARKPDKGHRGSTPAGDDPLPAHPPARITTR